MPKSRPPYPAAFRQQMVELVRSGRTPGELAREFEPSAEAIRNWAAQADRDAGKRSDGLRTEEHEEIRRLRRENRQLREERSRALLVRDGVMFMPNPRNTTQAIRRSVDSSSVSAIRSVVLTESMPIRSHAGTRE